MILSRGGEYFLKTDQIGHWGVGVVIGGKIKSVYSTVLARAPLVDTATAGKPAFGAFWLVAIAALVASVWGLRRRQRGRSPRRRESPAAPHARRLPLIDSLRAIAALATHAGWYSGMNTSSAWGRYTEHLDAGVAIFFLISGLLLYRPFVLALDSLPAYLDQFALSNDGR